MKSFFGIPFKRLALALALSLLVHVLLLWQWPKFQPPRTEETLPPLQAKLEHLPKLARKTVPHKQKNKPAPPVPEVVPEVITTPGVSFPVAIEPTAASEPAITGTLAPPATTEEVSSLPQLPKHALLRFAVQYQAGTFKLGEVTHVLESKDGRYSLHAETHTTGLVSLFKSYHLSQTSTGSVNSHGLRPDGYAEVKTDSSGKQATIATFDWPAHKIHYADGQENVLPDQTQDVLSLPYHISQQPINVTSIAIVLSKGKKISRQYISIGDEGTISTPMGELRTITLSKVHGANEEGLIIWLALEYRLLPVKILYLDKSGAISANMVITDIRVSDE